MSLSFFQIERGDPCGDLQSRISLMWSGKQEVSLLGLAGSSNAAAFLPDAWSSHSAAAQSKMRAVLAADVHEPVHLPPSR